MTAQGNTPGDQPVTDEAAPAVPSHPTIEQVPEATEPTGPTGPTGPTPDPAAPDGPADLATESTAPTPDPAAGVTAPATRPPSDAPRPTPPRPGPPRPRPPVGAPTGPQSPSAPTAPASPSASGPSPRSFGRVAEDGTVLVRVGEAEHAVGQYPEGSAEEALDFFVRRFEALDFEVTMLDKRVRSGSMSADDVTAAMTVLTDQLDEPHSVGDLAGLRTRLDALGPVVEKQRTKRRAERAAAVERSRERKAAIVAEAEALGAGSDWRDGADRLLELLEEWKGLPRLDKKSDDELWKRFSGSRTAYSRHRKAHFAEQKERRGSAKQVKERLVVAAEALATSTDWGKTSRDFRDLMGEWKAAGAAQREVENRLWARFRGAQDTFFGARDAANAELDKEFAANAEKKEALLVEAEALLPVTDVAAAKRAFGDLADRWDGAGKVPRDRMGDLEARMRKVEQAIRGVEDEKWKRSDPEKSARADDMVSKLRAAIAGIEADLTAARDQGDDRVVRSLEENLASRQSFLDMALRASADYSS